MSTVAKWRIQLKNVVFSDFFNTLKNNGNISLKI